MSTECTFARPSLRNAALTLPLVSDSPTGSDNTTIPIGDVFFPSHGPPPKKQHNPKGPPCNDYRCPGPAPRLSIQDVL